MQHDLDYIVEFDSLFLTLEAATDKTISASPYSLVLKLLTVSHDLHQQTEFSEVQHNYCN